MIGDSTRISVTVAVPPPLAFELFTEEIDCWWRRGIKFRHSGSRAGFVRLEPGVGGRLFESFDDANGTQLVEVGRVSVWDPPKRLAFSWRNANFSPTEHTNVEVEFVPTAAGTQVSVTHRGLSALRNDHPARHGLLGTDFSRMIGLWWGEQMTEFRRLTADGDSKTRPDSEA